jgi:hypothetical protein
MVSITVLDVPRHAYLRCTVFPVRVQTAISRSVALLTLQLSLRELDREDPESTLDDGLGVDVSKLPN